MRRILLVLTVAALMAAMMVTAGPAKANVSINSGGSSFGNSSNFSSGGSFISVGNDVAFGFGDNDDDDIFSNDGFFFSSDSDFDDIDFGGIEFS